jgi:hypothetical protein
MYERAATDPNQHCVHEDTIITLEMNHGRLETRTIDAAIKL